MKNGKAVQLATHAAGRRQKRGDTLRFPPVAYLVLKTGSFFTPEDNALRGIERRGLVPEARAIEVVWTRFVEALRRADGWTSGTEPIPARPLQNILAWPEDVGLVLEPGRKGEAPGFCRFCHYPVLCGLKRVR